MRAGNRGILRSTWQAFPARIRVSHTADGVILARPATEAIAHVPELDGLRGCAVILILLLHWHAIAMGDSLGLLGRVLDIGWVGVELFFVLSGYLITSILLSTKESPEYFKSFYGRRAVRIFPLYFVSLILFYHVQLPLMHRAGEWQNITNAGEIWNWLQLQNWRAIYLGHGTGPIMHFWSLAVEEQFYLVWPLVVWKCSKRSLPVVCVVLIALCFVTSGVFEWLRLPYVWHYRASIPRSASILSGSLIAWVLREGVGPQFAKIARWAFIIAGLGANVLSAARLPYWRGSETVLDMLVTTSFVSLVFFCVAESKSSAWECRLARNPVLRNFGKYSYAIYVLHFTFIWPYVPGLVYQYAYLRPSWMSLRMQSYAVYAACLVALVVGSYGAAVISWYVLEQPFLSLRRYFPYENKNTKREDETAKPVSALAQGRA